MIQPQPYPLVYKNAVPEEFTAYVNEIVLKNIDEFSEKCSRQQPQVHEDGLRGAGRRRVPL